MRSEYLSPRAAANTTNEARIGAGAQSESRGSFHVVGEMIAAIGRVAGSELSSAEFDTARARERARFLEEQLDRRALSWWDEKHTLLLIPPAVLDKLPGTVELTSIHGDTLSVRQVREQGDHDTRFGMLAWGLSFGYEPENTGIKHGLQPPAPDASPLVGRRE